MRPPSLPARTTGAVGSAQAGAGGKGVGGEGGVFPTYREAWLSGTSTVLPADETDALPSYTEVVVRSPLRSMSVSRDAALTRPPPLTASSTVSPRSAARPAFTSPACTSTAG